MYLRYIPRSIDSKGQSKCESSQWLPSAAGRQESQAQKFFTASISFASCYITSFRRMLTRPEPNAAYAPVIANVQTCTCTSYILHKYSLIVERTTLLISEIAYSIIFYQVLDIAISTAQNRQFSTFTFTLIVS
jgi:hypothetical protein